MRAGGWIKDRPDSRDRSFSLVAPAMAAAARSAAGTDHIIHDLAPVVDQLSLSSCVANATTNALEILMGLQDPSSVVQLSRLAVYWNARAYTQATGQDAGTYVRDAVDSLKKLGVCREDVWPYDVREVFSQPPIRSYQESLDNKVEAYYSVDLDGSDRLDAIELAVRADHPVVFGTMVSDDFERYFNRSDVVWDAPSSWVGGHALVASGVRYVDGERQFLIKNSWSSSWGDGGRTWFKESYMVWGQTDDLWVMTRVPALVF